MLVSWGGMWGNQHFAEWSLGLSEGRKVRLEGDEASTCKQVGSGLARHPGDGRTGGSGRFGFGDLLGFM